MTTPDTNLRTALEATIDRADPPGGMRAGTPSVSVAVLRALLAAHPAPEAVRSGHDIACDADHLDASCICDEITPAPVSDTRREDVVIRALRAHATWGTDPGERGVRCFCGASLESVDAHDLHLAASILALLPAPPVEHLGIADVLRAGTEIQAQTEAALRERIARDIEAAEAKIRGHVDFERHRDDYTSQINGLRRAARIVRGEGR